MNTLPQRTAWAARACGVCVVVLPCLMSAVVSTHARADVYKWVDEHGNTIISNVRPSRAKVTQYEVTVEDSPAVARSPQRVTTPTEQMLLDKVDRLERQLAAQQYAPPPPPTYYSGYDYTPPPPPPYYSSYYPSYYYPWVPSYSVAVPGRTFVSRPRFAFTRSFAVRGGFAHRGRR
jgi:hypothetical protein